MNLNLKLDVRTLAAPLARYGTSIFIMLVGVVGVYTMYFITNLFYSKADLDALASKQETTQTKQIKFNQKTLDSLDKLVPSDKKPDTSNVGRSNPFAPL